MVTIFRHKGVDLGMSVQKRERRRALGTFRVSQNGDSKALNCIRSAEQFDLPTEFGDEYSVEVVEDSDGTHLEAYPVDD